MHCAWIEQAERTPQESKSLNLQCRPAVGTPVPLKSWGFGTSRWQFRTGNLLFSHPLRKKYDFADFPLGRSRQIANAVSRDAEAEDAPLRRSCKAHSEAIGAKPDKPPTSPIRHS
jgi:hypothetical protein